MIKFHKLALTSMVLLALTFSYIGCSGGGGGGDSDGVASELAYSGVTTPAQIDESNAAEIAGGAFATGLIGDGMVGFSVDQQIESYHMGNFRSVSVPLILSDSLDLLDFTSSSSGNAQAAVQNQSDVIDGSCGGKMSYSITFDDRQGIFSGSFAFSDYCSDGTIINGSAGFNGRIDVDSGNFIEAIFTFDRLSGAELLLDGEMLIDFGATQNIVTLNAYGQDPITGAVFWINNYSITIDEYTGFVEIDMTGTFYHPDFGSVVLSTPVSLVMHDGDEWPESGTIVVLGANDSKAELTAYDYLTCTVKVDGDGDGTYEWDSSIMNWEDL